MARKLERIMAGRPAKRRAKIAARADNLATLKTLRQAVAQTQEDLAAELGVGQDTISSLEKRSDMLLSTLRRYVKAVGGELELVTRFPNRKPMIIGYLHADRKDAGDARKTRLASSRKLAA